MKPKTLFRLIFKSRQESDLFKYEDDAKADLERGDLHAYEFRADEKSDGDRKYQFVIETFDWDVLKRYRAVGRDDDKIIWLQFRKRVFVDARN